jgi:lysophospholipase L1-like esterase
MEHIIVFGASIVWGAWDDERGGWVERLKTEVGPTGLQVYNCGISGDMSSDVLARFSSEAKARADGKETAVVFSAGINDSAYEERPETPRVSKSQFEENIRELVSQARGITPHVLIVGLALVDESKVQPVAWNAAVNYSNENICAYNAIVKQVCADEGLPYLDIENLLSPADLADGLHPNAEGHRKMHEAIRAFFVREELLKS